MKREEIREEESEEDIQKKGNKGKLIRKKEE